MKDTTVSKFKHRFYVWCVMVDGKRNHDVIGVLVKRKYTVTALGDVVYTTRDTCDAGVMGLEISCDLDEEGTDPARRLVFDDIKDIFKTLEVPHHALVLTCPTNSTWNVGNYKTPSPEVVFDGTSKPLN